jgi:hypothetical protein
MANDLTGVRRNDQDRSVPCDSPDRQGRGQRRHWQERTLCWPESWQVVARLVARITMIYFFFNITRRTPGLSMTVPNNNTYSQGCNQTFLQYLDVLFSSLLLGSARDGCTWLRPQNFSEEVRP